jgi:hypothetical protein
MFLYLYGRRSMIVLALYKLMYGREEKTSDSGGAGLLN